MKIVRTCLVVCVLLLAPAWLHAERRVGGDRHRDIAEKVDVSVRLNVEWPRSSLRITITNRSDTTLAFLPFSIWMYRVRRCTPNMDIHAAWSSLTTLIPWHVYVDSGVPDGCEQNLVRFHEVTLEPVPQWRWMEYFVVQPVAVPSGTSAEFSWGVKTADSATLASGVRECLVDTFSLPLYVVDDAFRARMGENMVLSTTRNPVYTMEGRDVGPSYLNMKQHVVAGIDSHVVLDYDDAGLLKRQKLIVRRGGPASCTCVVGPPTDAGE